MSTTAAYDLSKLKPDGSHYVVVGFAIPHCLQLPDGNYSVSITNYKISTFSKKQPLAVQIVLEKKQKSLSQAEIHLVQRETWEMAGPHGTYGYTLMVAMMSSPPVFNRLKPQQRRYG
ncbi:MAG: hypothetical protein BroJett011_50870 [Chloroflexota bacterium]|nr:MAG: hypothetical protein BroJett011_50870 [Chloroflexota bacterium]